MPKKIKIRISVRKKNSIVYNNKFKRLFSRSFSYLKKIFKKKKKKLFPRCFLYLEKSFSIVLADIKNKKWRGLIVILLTISAFFLWGLSISILCLLFLIFLVYGWENRIIAILALLSLAFCPILLTLKKGGLAEQMAVYAFFFLGMAVILQIIDDKFGKYLRDKKIW